MNLKQLYQTCKDGCKDGLHRHLKQRQSRPVVGERYYDVLRGSECVVIRESDSKIVLRYEEGEQRPFTHESWDMALEAGRFKRETA